jgi:nitroimidazol reductase NimA-like FMN-containing flavoprotein (pyridoxamine 5'-phosphate oxidase superfamily)
MRRKDRQISNTETIEIINKGEYGVLSMCAPDNKAYGVPLNYVFWNNCIYFHCAKGGFKMDNLDKNNNVSFCIVGNTELLPDKFSTRYESAIIFGKTEEVKEKEKFYALIELVKKYSSEFLENGKRYIQDLSDNTTVIKIRIDEITGKARK